MVDALGSWLAVSVGSMASFCDFIDHLRWTKTRVLCSFEHHLSLFKSNQVSRLTGCKH